MGAQEPDYFFRNYADVDVCATFVEPRDMLTLVYRRDGVEEQVSIEMVEERVRVRSWHQSGGTVTQGIADMLEYLPGLIMDIGSDERVQQFYKPLRELYQRSVN